MYTKSQVIDYIWQYSRYYGNQLIYLGQFEENGSASLLLLFNLLENILKAHLDDFDDTFHNIVKKSHQKKLLTKTEYDFLNNKETGVRRLRNVFAHANLSKFNLRFDKEELLYPLTENDNCQILYKKLSDIILNIMLKCAVKELKVDINVNIDTDIKALKIEIVEFTPEDILLDKGIEPSSLKGWKELNESSKYRHAENAQNVNVLAHIFAGINQQLE